MNRATAPDGGARLARLLRPRSIAVIGGEEAARVVEQCDRLGFDGPIWPVNPRRGTLGGRTCYASVADLPHAPDAAYVAVNRDLTVEVVGALAALGCGGVVCYAAGFDEVSPGGTADPDSRQSRLVKAAGAMALIGPNCYGFINVPARVALWPDQHGAEPCTRGVAIITQSSNVAISLSMQTRSLPIACVMTAGNQAQTGLSHLAHAMLDDPAVSAIGLHIEGLDDVRAFEALAARARALAKPVVALKVGRSRYAQRAALTHTASLAGSAEAFDALARRLGVATVTSLETFCETLKLLHVHGPLAGRRVLSLSCSGGEAALVADALEHAGLESPDFDAARRGELQALAGEVVTVSNPFDYNTFVWGDWARMQALYRTALGADVDVAALVLDLPRADRCNTSDWDNALAAFLAAASTARPAVAVVATLPENLPEAVAARLCDEGVTPLLGIGHAMAAIRAAADIGTCWGHGQAAPVAGPAPAAASTRALDEASSKRLLASRGVLTPAGVVVTGGEDAAARISTLGDGPFALKALDVAHKSEAGAVRLGLADGPAVIAAMANMPSPAGRYLVESMVPAPVIAELIVGVTRDPVIGPVLTLGAGGTLTELLRDSVTLVLPADAEAVGEALRSLRVHALLGGFRGRPAADQAAIAESVCRIADLALNEPVVELDVNPLMVTPHGCIAADALVVLDDTPRRG